jgi:hypothetical protein
VSGRSRANALRRRLDIAFRVRRPPHIRFVDPTVLWGSPHPTALNGAIDFQIAARHLRLTELSPDLKPRLQAAADAPAPALSRRPPSSSSLSSSLPMCGVPCNPPFLDGASDLQDCGFHGLQNRVRARSFTFRRQLTRSLGLALFVPVLLSLPPKAAAPITLQEWGAWGTGDVRA